MALISIQPRRNLGPIDVLAAERYDPRRTLDSNSTPAVLLGGVATMVRCVVQPTAELGRCLVLDTSDAREGVVIARKVPVDGSAIGSAKKVTRAHDVILSRLRPYLRQVAFVDEEIPHAQGALLLCSTEFFVLRSPEKRSIAFLVPFLLSRPVQQVLAAAQEGGHHPRVGDATLLTLPVPVALLDQRDAISATIERSVELYRKSEQGVDEMVARAEAAFT